MGESCLGGGHVFVQDGYDGSRCYHLCEDPADLIYTGMAATHRHLAIARSDDVPGQELAHGDKAQRAIGAD